MDHRAIRYVKCRRVENPIRLLCMVCMNRYQHSSQRKPELLSYFLANDAFARPVSI